MEDTDKSTYRTVSWRWGRSPVTLHGVDASSTLCSDSITLNRIIMRNFDSYQPTRTDFGLNFPHTDTAHRAQIISYINFKLATHGLSNVPENTESMLDMAGGMVRNFREKNRLLQNHLPPVDDRVQQFLDDYLAGLGEDVPRLPGDSFVLDRYGLAREMSIPPYRDSYHTEDISSYRTKQGVLHNPKHDRRTTKGVFHVAEDGFPIPLDKKAVPRLAYLVLAWRSPADLTPRTRRPHPCWLRAHARARGPLRGDWRSIGRIYGGSGI